MLALSLEYGSIWSQSTAPRAQDILLRLGAPYSHGLQIPYTGREPVQFHSCCILPQCLEVLLRASSDDSFRPLTELVRGGFYSAELAPLFFAHAYYQRAGTLNSGCSRIKDQMSFPGISFSTWDAEPGMRRIVNRNSSRMEAGESCKKVYRNYLNYSWPAGSLPSSRMAREPSRL